MEGKILISGGQPITFNYQPLVYDDTVTLPGFLVFTTNASTLTFDPGIDVLSGTAEWNLGDGSIVNTNTVNHTYASDGNKEVNVYLGTVPSVPSVTSLNIASDNIVGTLDLSELTGLTQLTVNSNREMTSIINPSSSTNFSFYRADVCDLTGTLDLTPLTGLNGTIFLGANSNLTEVLFPDTSASISYLQMNGSGMTTIDVSNLSGLGGYFYVGGNTQLENLLLPSSTQTFTDFYIQQTGLQTIDLSGLIMEDTFIAYNCPSLNMITFPESSGAWSNVSFYNTNFTGTVDFRPLQNLGGYVRFGTNIGITEVLNPTSDAVFSRYDAVGCNITGVLDVSGLTNLGGYFGVNGNSNLTQILFPETSTHYTTLALGICDLTGVLDLTPAGEHLAPAIYFQDNPNLTEVRIPACDKVITQLVGNDCDQLQALDVSGLTNLGGYFYFYGCPSLKTLTLPPTTSQTFSSFTFALCDLTGELDLTAVPNVGGSILLTSNSNLTSVKFPANSNLIQVWMSGTAVPTIDVSGFTSLRGRFYSSGSPNLTSIAFPTSTEAFTQMEMQTSDLTGTLDVSGLANIGGIFNTSTNPNLQEILFPTFNDDFTTFYVNDCSLGLFTVDDIFSKMNAWFSSNTPTSSLTINTSGGTNMPPTDGSSNSDIVNLESIFDGAGKSLVITINYP